MNAFYSLNGGELTLRKFGEAKLLITTDSQRLGPRADAE